MSSQQVGGDLYDVFPLGPTSVGVVVADVSGKGIAASLLMAVCRTHLRQIAPRHASPAAALRELNRTLSAELKPSMYITLVYAVIDSARNTLVFARAGHELPLLLHRESATGSLAASFLASEGMAVGLVPHELFASAIEDETRAFGAGDVLVLYTDGLTEAPNEDGKEFSNTRLADVARAAYGAAPAQINDAILSAVQRFSGETPQRDDFTLLTVQRV
jgi:sigma-B regulation protein RsbU (phosphoserine phosphatase)